VLGGYLLDTQRQQKDGSHNLEGYSSLSRQHNTTTSRSEVVKYSKFDVYLGEKQNFGEIYLNVSNNSELELLG